MNLSRLIRVVFLFSAAALPAYANNPAQLAPAPVKDSLPRAYRDLHPDSGTMLTFLTPKNMYREVNPVLPIDAALQAVAAKPATPVRAVADETATFSKDGTAGHLARVTAYWPGEPGDYYTTMHMSSTGVHLQVGHCAVDPSIIPYGSLVEIPGVGDFLAVDTGSAVVSRLAARAGRTVAERGALVIDLYFASESDGQQFASHAPSYVTINWRSPGSLGQEAKLARSLASGEE
jgi:3D (Asp-Asp-Asp) domain-containing protein